MKKPSEIQTAFNALIDSINELGKDAGGLRPSDLMAVNNMTTAIKNLKADNAALVEALGSVKIEMFGFAHSKRDFIDTVIEPLLKQAKGDVC